MNLETLPPRIPTEIVLQLAGFGHQKLRKRMNAGKFPKPIDRGGKGYIFRTEDVLNALAINSSKTSENPFEAALDET